MQLDSFYSGSLPADDWAYYSLNLAPLPAGWDLVLQVEQLGDTFSNPDLYLTFVSYSY